MNLQEAVKAYAHAWSLRDAVEIAEVLAPYWAETGTYTDPATDTVSGVEGLAGVILGYAAKYPGMDLQPTSGLDSYGATGRFSWVLTSPTPVVVGEVDYGYELPGLDFVEFTAHGRICRVVGFFGSLS